MSKYFWHINFAIILLLSGVVIWDAEFPVRIMSVIVLGVLGVSILIYLAHVEISKR